MQLKHPHLIHPNYRPDIDGLRAVAVMAVVGYHAFPGMIQGGFIGVDIFFVISGYLISTIIFSSLERDRFSLAEFYVRRIRRIFPALVFVLLAVFIFGWYVLLSDEFAQLGKHMAGGAGFVSNFILWNESGYFDREAVTKPLLHLWSLGIEEQFYIFWPLLLAFVWKRRHWSFLQITTLIAVASFAANIYLIYTDPVGSFYSPISRFWELMVGGALAYMVLHRPQMISRFRNVRSLLGFTLIGVALVLLEKTSAFPGWWALLPAMGAFFIISAGPNAWLNKKLLSGRVMLWIGLISYPLYLWHWPLLSFADILGNGVVPRDFRIAAVLFSVLLAWLTYRFIESPLRSGHRKIPVTSGLLLIMSGVVIIGLLGYKGVITPRNDNVALANIIEATKDWQYPGDSEPYDPGVSGTYIYKSKRSDITLFIGDSHVEQYAARVSSTVHSQPLLSNSAVFVTDGGCVFIPGVLEDSPVHRQCSAVKDYAFKLAYSDKVETVVIGGAWDSYLYYLNSDKEDLSSPAGYHYYFLDHGDKISLRGGHGVQLALNSLEEQLRALSKIKKVYLLLDNPSGANYDPHKFFSGSRLRGYVVNNHISETVLADPKQVAIREVLLRMADRLGIDVIDPVPLLCRNSLCLRARDGQPVYKDGSHLRASFVRDNATYIDRSLLEH
ncbi:acyltransferase family protein [Mariprofundus ferrooxydans]|uniref:acyltransferase family protein n=1 Tax=Mariprofundus ferrooxydans TaxID=314344 RepID=UPI00197F0E58|nr:acyltransferase family protein [Mariprofundus ferrooxydans]